MSEKTFNLFTCHEDGYQIRIQTVITETGIFHNRGRTLCQSHKKLRNTPSGKLKIKKHTEKRRQRRQDLEFIPLNEPFEGSEGHHIDKEFVVYIPAEMHKSVSHNVFTGKDMDEINDKAIDFVYGD